jgi:hypothetical protein
MARLRRILGIVILILGVAIVALAFTVLTSIPSQTIPPSSSGSQASISINTLTSGSLSISWSGAASGTSVQMYSCPDASCSGTYTVSQLTLVASGSGSSGSFSGSVQPGHTYLLTETGTAGGLSVTGSLTGLSWWDIIGIVVAVIGAILVVLPARAPRTTEEEMPSETPEAEEVIHPAQMSAPVSAAPTVAQSPTSAVAGPSTVVGGAGPGRANLKCAHCGTMNEPWITNCRWCKRPLSSTHS